MKTQFMITCLLATALGLSMALPVVEKEFFWFTTDTGNVIPAFIHGEPPKSEQIQAIEDNVEFWHYLNGEEEGRQVTPGCEDCTSNFIQGAPLIIGAHGFGGSHLDAFGNHLREAFTKRGEPVNVILINWKKLAAAPNYLYAVNSVKKVGEYTAQLVNFLVEQGLVSVENSHFVGFSLGAHIVNYISSNLNNGKLHRVYGLDPAMVLFNTMDVSKRISEHDGEHVLVIHASMSFLGINLRSGHADFYPNSGKQQVGCDEEFPYWCSHGRSVDYFTESVVSSNAFPSCKCDSWEEFSDGSCSCDQLASMGWDTPFSTRGTFYLKTNPASPFSL